MMSMYESRLAVNLSAWCFEVEIRSTGGTARHFVLKIPEHNILSEYADGRKLLRIMAGRDTVDLPKELFQCLLKEIESCQDQLRSSHGRSRPRSDYQ